MMDAKAIAREMVAVGILERRVGSKGEQVRLTAGFREECRKRCATFSQRGDTPETAHNLSLLLTILNFAMKVGAGWVTDDVAEKMFDIAMVLEEHGSA